MRAWGIYVWIALGALAAFLVGLFVLDGSAQAVLVVAAVAVFLFAVVRALDSESYGNRDKKMPSPPGSHGGPWG
jgi:hypothetical protein